MSLNRLCISALQSHLEPVPRESPHSLPVSLDKIRSLVGESLAGVLLFGSTARNEQRESSDIDLLIAVNDELPLTRALYDRWDEVFAAAEAPPVNPHFVHLPCKPAAAGSLWCEAAVDAVLLHDPEGRIADVLRQIRRAVAEGKLLRKSAYGHPYWIRLDGEVERVQ
jgi:predicted nucleotidyltransferase